MTFSSSLPPPLARLFNGAPLSLHEWPLPAPLRSNQQEIRSSPSPCWSSPSPSPRPDSCLERLFDLQPTPSPSISPTPSHKPRRGRVACRYALHGFCLNKDDCRFSHDIDVLALAWAEENCPAFLREPPPRQPAAISQLVFCPRAAGSCSCRSGTTKINGTTVHTTVFDGGDAIASNSPVFRILPPVDDIFSPGQHWERGDGTPL